ncbi:hypothetical protein RRG08_023485 [Elysia crispata]|uniref:Uncharacterized protein n=1 Tax=Elysia crispata TaxID=231223 RepID=A0AAE0YYC6_9GAST|nr:hypothetical protein RRG08_023485 [Elysia crispata]
MFRFNFWAKPFFTPPPGSGGMENAPPFVPNPLTSPALMVLASTAAAEGHEVQRLQAAQQQQQQHSQHHPSFPGRGMDKDLPPPPPPPPFSTAAFMYRPGDPFSAPLYSPLSFVRPELDRRLALMNPGMRPGAFRPLATSGNTGGDVDVPQTYHSAFSPASTAPSLAKKPKSEETSPGGSAGATIGGNGGASMSASSTASTSSSSEHHPHHPHGAQFPDHGQPHDDRPPSLCYRGEPEDGRVCSPDQHGGTIKEERPASLCSSQGYDTVSEPMSDSGDAYERGTPDSEGRSLRSKLFSLYRFKGWCCVSDRHRK